MANNAGNGLDIIISVKGDVTDFQKKLTGLSKNVVQIEKDTNNASNSILSFSQKSSEAILKALQESLVGAKKGSAEYKATQQQIQEVAKATLESVKKSVEDYGTSAERAYKRIQDAAVKSSEAAAKGSSATYAEAKRNANNAVAEYDNAVKRAEEGVKRADELAQTLGTKAAESMKQQAEAVLALAKSQKQAISDIYDRILDDQKNVQAQFIQNAKASAQAITGDKVQTFYMPTEEDADAPYKIITETQEAIGKVRQTIYQMSQDTGEFIPVSEKVLDEFTKQEQMVNQLANTLTNLSTKYEKLSQDAELLSKKTGNNYSLVGESHFDAEQLRNIADDLRTGKISIDEAARSVEEFSTKLAENQNQLAYTKTEYADMTQSYDKASNSLDKLKERLQNMSISIQAADKDGRTVAGTYDEVKTTVSDLIAEADKIKNSGLTGQDFVNAVDGLAKSTSDADLKFKELQKTAERLPMTMEQAKSAIADLSNGFAGIQQNLNKNSGNYAPAVFKSLKKEVADARKELETLSNKKVLSEDDIRRVAELRVLLKEYRAELKETIVETPKVGEQTKTAFEKAKEGIEPLKTALIVMRSKLVELSASFADNRFDGFITDIDQAIAGLDGLANASDRTYVQQQHLFKTIESGNAALEGATQAYKRAQVDAEKLSMTQEEATQKSQKLGDGFHVLEAKMNKAKVGYVANTFDELEKQIIEAKDALALLNNEFSQDHNLQKYENGLKDVEGRLANATSEYNKQLSTGEKTITGDNFWQNMGKYARWYFGGNLITGAKRQVQEALTEMKAVDAELIQIKKVTDASDESLKKIGNRAYEVGKKYGVAASEYLNAVAAYSRAGMGDAAEEMADLSVKASLVGDMAQEDATAMFLAIQKAYKTTNDELSQILDGLNELDNKHATTIENITEGLGKVASIASVAHVGYDELAASIGTITAVTQRSGTEAATALRALFLNIIGDTKTEIEEGETATITSINNIKDALKKYAPDVVEYADRTKTIINPLEAIEALAEAYEKREISEQKLAEILSGIGGKLRTGQLTALIMNWDEYVSQLEHFNDSFGSADREVTNALDSWERKVQILSNTWTEFISKSVNTDLIKGAIDRVTRLIEGIGNLGNGLLIVSGIVAAIKMERIFSGVEKTIKRFQDFKDGIETAKNAVLKFIGVSQASRAEQTASAAASAAETAATTANTAAETAETGARAANSAATTEEAAATAENAAATDVDTASNIGNAGSHAARAAAIGITTAAVTVLTLAVAAGIIAHNKYVQGLHDAAEKSGDAAKASYNEADQLYNLYRAYLYCEDGSKAQQEASEKLNDALKKEGKTVEDLEEAYKNLTKEKLEEAKASTSKAVYDQAKVLEEAYKPSLGVKSTLVKGGFQDPRLSGIAQIFGEASRAGTITFNGNRAAYQAKSGAAKDIAEYYKVLNKAHKELLRRAAEDESIYESQVFKDVQAALNGFGDAAEEYLERIERKKAIIAELEAFKAATGETDSAFASDAAVDKATGTIQRGTQEAKQYIEDYINFLRQSGEYTEQELSAIAEEWERFDSIEDIEADCRKLLDSLDMTADTFDEIGVAAEDAKSAIDRFNDALKVKNTDALEAYVKLFKEFTDAADKGAYGSVQFQQGAKALFNQDFINSFGGDWGALSKEAQKFSGFLSDAESYAVGLYDYWAGMSENNPEIDKQADGVLNIANGLLTIKKTADGGIDWNLDADTVEEAATAIEKISGITGTNGELIAAIFQSWGDFSLGIGETFRSVGEIIAQNREALEKNKDETDDVKNATGEAANEAIKQKDNTEETATAIAETKDNADEMASSLESASESTETIESNTFGTKTNVEDIGEKVAQMHHTLAMIEELVQGIYDAAKDLQDSIEVDIDSSSAREAKEDADDLSKAVAAIPVSVSIYIPLDAFTNAITAANNVAAAVNAIPTYHRIVIETVEIGGSGGGTGGNSGAKGSGVGGKIATTKAEGTQNFTGGEVLVNDEPGGFNPELIVANGRAFIANGGNPALITLPHGAQIYNADETRAIFAGGEQLIDIPAFGMGGKVPGNKKDDSGSGGGGKKSSDSHTHDSDDSDKNEWFDLLKEYMEELYEDAEAALDEQKEAINAQILALKYQTEAAEKANDLEEKRLEMVKAESDLLDAQHERTVRYFNAETNQWEWMADQQAVLDAQEALADAQKDYLDAQYDYLEDLWKKIEDEISDYLEEKNDLNIEDILNQLSGSAAGSELASVTELIQAIKDFTSSPTAGLGLKDIASVYDSGGIASGKGFMPKGNSGDEIVLDSILAGRILSPKHSGELTAFTENLASLLDMSSASANPQSLLNRLSNVTNNNGNNTIINGVSIGSDYMDRPLSDVLSVLGIYANS